MTPEEMRAREEFFTDGVESSSLREDEKPDNHKEIKISEFSFYIIKKEE